MKKIIDTNRLEQALEVIKKINDGNGGTSIPNPIPVSMGGTGANDASTARANLDAAQRNHSHSASDITGLNIPSPSSSTPRANSGSGSIGSSSQYARADHVHPDSSIPTPLPTSKGGTGNTDGYIQTGRRSGTRVGNYATIEGHDNEASGNYSHVEGSACIASGNYSHVEGSACIASGAYSHAGGTEAKTYGQSSFAHGDCTIAKTRSQFAIGHYNRDMGGRPLSSNSDAMFLIGKGSSEYNAANCFRVGYDSVWGGTYRSSGADYAEMFEWADGNPDDEDRVGRFVTLVKNKISYATTEQEDVLGITSAAPSVCGDTYDDQWQGMFETDIFGRPIYEDVTVPAKYNPDGTEIHPEFTEKRQKINPKYQSLMAYESRTNRPEWTPVGIVGKLVMLQDGTITEPGQYVKPSTNGIGTLSNTKTNCKVMQVLDDTHIQIFIK